MWKLRGLIIDMDDMNLPPIKIIRNPRSKNLRLRVDQSQIRLTAPVYCSERQIKAFIEQSQTWLIQTWTAQQNQRNIIPKELPKNLKLFNLEHDITIEYQVQKANFIFDEEHLKLSISQRHPETYLKSFVIHYAKQHLPLFLESLSHQYQLPYRACHIRQPKTRWGSCSMHHDIMLNSALVLFPEKVVRYVCIHELTHTVHFDHSINFWNKVSQYDLQYLIHRKALKTSPLPYWWNSSLI